MLYALIRFYPSLSLLITIGMVGTDLVIFMTAKSFRKKPSGNCEKVYNAQVLEAQGHTVVMGRDRKCPALIGL